MSDENNTKYYFAPITIPKRYVKLDATTRIINVDYPNTTDVSIRHNNREYIPETILFVKNGAQAYMVISTKADNATRYYLATKINNAPNASDNCINDLLQMSSTSTTTQNAFFDYTRISNPTNATTLASTSYVSGKNVLTIFDAPVNVTYDVTAKITGTSTNIPFNGTVTQITLSPGQPHVVMDCNSRGSNMSKTQTVTKPMSDNDIMTMMITSIVIFSVVIGAYVYMFDTIYTKFVINGMKSGPGVSAYANLYWLMVIILYAFVTFTYGLSQNNSSYLWVSVLFIAIIAMSSFLYGSSEIVKNTTFTYDWTAFTSIITKSNMTMIGAGLCAIGFIVGILASVASFGQLTPKRNAEGAFIGTSTAFLASSIFGYAFIVLSRVGGIVSPTP